MKFNLQQENRSDTEWKRNRRIGKGIEEDWLALTRRRPAKLALVSDLFMDYIWTGKEVSMKLSSQIKPISYLKAHVSEIVRTLGEQREPMVITQNGEAKVVLQDIDSFEQTQETMALLKMLALGNRQIEAGQVEAAADVITRLRERTPDR